MENQPQFGPTEGQSANGMIDFRFQSVTFIKIKNVAPTCNNIKQMRMQRKMPTIVSNVFKGGWTPRELRSIAFPKNYRLLKNMGNQLRNEQLSIDLF